MFIVWGKKAVYRKIGFVADFCAMCRTVKPFEIKRIGMAGHVYYITSGEGELLGYQRTCLSCKTAVDTDPNGYTAIEKSSCPSLNWWQKPSPRLKKCSKSA
jgi:hypothetical protein